MTIKTTDKKTCICFADKQAQKTGIDFLLRLNIPFTYLNGFPIVFVNPKLFIKHDLDLYLQNVLNFHSRFNYKQSKK